MRETPDTDRDERAPGNGSSPAPAARCPICDGAVDADGEFFPFCAKRCRLVDLGRWLGGGYVVSRPLTDEEFGEV